MQEQPYKDWRVVRTVELNAPAPEVWALVGGFFNIHKWHEGEWGEKVQKYVAEIRVLEVELDKSCIVQWSSTFYYFEDALTQFYQNGFDALQAKFG